MEKITIKPISKYDLFDTYLVTLNRKLPYKFMESNFDCHYYIEAYIDVIKDDHPFRIVFETDAFSTSDCYTLQQVEKELINITYRYQQAKDIFNI